MGSTSRSKRRSKIAPITVDELLGAAGMSGFVSFLNVKPEDYGRPGPGQSPSGETEPASTVEVESPAIVEAGPSTTMEAGPCLTDEAAAASTMEAGTSSTEGLAPDSTIEAGPPATMAAESTSTIVVDSLSTIGPDDPLSGDYDVNKRLSPVIRDVPPEPPTTIEAGSTSTVESVAPSTMEAGSPSTVEATGATFWTIEGLGGAFPTSRLRRIERAQDVLTHVEESVYDALWGVKDYSRDRCRQIVMGYEEIARKARASKRGVVAIIQRLQQKGFIEIVRAPVTFGERRPTEYRVFSYGAVLERQRARNRLWTIRTGNGIGYAHPLNLEPSRRTIEVGAASTVEAGQQSTVDVGQRSTVEAAQSSTIDAGSTITSIDRKTRQNISTTPAMSVVTAIHEAMGRTDDDAAARIVEDCRQTTPDITDEEIAHFIRQEGPALRKNPVLDNPMGVLIRHIPRCCRGESLRLYREAVHAEQNRNRRQVEAWLEDARQIFANANASPADRVWAEDILATYAAGQGRAR